MTSGRGELRWLIGTALVVGVLLLISALALDRPNVRWLRSEAHCPACRSVVLPFSNKCTECATDFDWVIAPDRASPVSSYALSPYDEEVLRDRVKKLGRPEAVRRIAEVMSFSTESAEAWLDSIGRGRCAVCGGTGRDLAETEGRADECALCFGGGACISSGEDRLVRVGDYEAEQALADYQAAIGQLNGAVPQRIRRREARRHTSEFLLSHAGTAQASQVLWWKDIAAGRDATRLAVQIGRSTLDRVLVALSPSE